MSSSNAADRIRRCLVARHAITAIVSWEEERVEATLAEVARTAFSSPIPFHVWARTTGLVGPDGAIPATEQPLAALQAVIDLQGQGVFLFRDLASYLGDPVLARKVRDVRRALAGGYKFVFLQSARLALPFDLTRDVAVIDFPLPSPEEVAALLDAHLAELKVPLVAEGQVRRQLVSALQGLTQNEAGHALNRALYGRNSLDEGVLSSLHEQKQQLARKEGVLEFVPQSWTIDDVGGLNVLKAWLAKRTRLFQDDSKDVEGLIPRGVLMMGISGCGKSLSVKAISALWNLPLFRLDMSQVFSSVHGTPEEAFDRALKTTEALAPCILWIDEIEGGISRETTGSDAGTKGRIFASFLTWMQEKSGRVFVAATANRIDLLPAEMLRKGRFDQIFFLDLPTEADRAQIFAVHLTKRGIDPEIFDLTVLAKSTKEWNGAEIEQCVVSAMVEAYAKEKPLDEDELFLQIGKIVPLAKTMSEQIKSIKSWAHDRAIRASTLQHGN